MIIDGEFTFAAPRETIWRLLRDPGVLVKAMPGATRLDHVGDGRYEGVLRIGVGPVTAAEWALSVVLGDEVEPESYTMQVDSKGPLGFTRGKAHVDLEEEEEGSTTRMCYRADLQVGGRVAGVGQRLIDQVAKLMTRQGLEALNREVVARLEADAVPGEASA
ncbi:hypothetical protein BH24GEM3_BH24GEM3_27450 [soil metagenome]